MRSALILLVPALLQAQLPADTGARPISLDEAITLARRNAPLAVQARGQLRSSAASVRSAYLAFIPSLDVSLASAFSEGDRFDAIRQEFVRASSWQYSDGLSARVEIFAGGRRWHDLKRAKAESNAAEANAVLQDFAVSLNVKQEFFNVLAARELQDAARAQLEQAEQQLRVAVARVAAGAATKSDSLRSLVQVGNARLALLNAGNALRTANAALTRLVATPFVVTAAPEAELESVEVALDSAALAGLAETGPAVTEAQAQVAAARAAGRAARTPYLPTISASFNRSGNGGDPYFGNGDERFSYNNRLVFSASYPLFNQFQREEQAVRASVAEDNAQAALRDARFRARQDLVEHLGAVNTSAQRIEIQLTSVAAAEEDLRVQQQRYALGASTLLDVLTSQTQLNQARADLIQARYDYRIARARLEALIGRDLDAVTAGPGQ